MKKRNLTSLSLNKRIVSKFKNTRIGGLGPELGTIVSIDDKTCLCTDPSPGNCPLTALDTCPTTCSPESCYAC